MPDAIDRAMVLAAGLGTRMRPLTDDRPKALVKVAGRALVDHAIDRLVEADVGRVVVNVHYFADLLEAHLKRRRDVRLIVADERAQLLDTGGGIANVLGEFGGAPFFTLNCDAVWIESGVANLPAMRRTWKGEIMDALMLLCPRREAMGYDGRGDFDMDSAGRLRRRTREQADFVWTGVQIVHPRLFADRPPGPFSTNLVWDKAIAAGRLFGMLLDGTWMHVGTPEAIAPTEARLARHRPVAAG